jgi:hypothetical protein
MLPTHNGMDSVKFVANQFKKLDNHLLKNVLLKLRPKQIWRMDVKIFL